MTGLVWVILLLSFILVTNLFEESFDRFFLKITKKKIIRTIEKKFHGHSVKEFSVEFIRDTLSVISLNSQPHVAYLKPYLFKTAESVESKVSPQMWEQLKASLVEMDLKERELLDFIVFLCEIRANHFSRFECCEFSLNNGKASLDLTLRRLL